MKIFKTKAEKENIAYENSAARDMSFPVFDIFSKIRSIIRGTTESNSLKRRSEEPPDTHFTKYRRVSNEFPEIINNSYEDEISFIQPSVMSKKRLLSEKKYQKTSSSNNQKKMFSNRSGTNDFAENEYSDEDEYCGKKLYQQQKPVSLASSSFNTEFKKSPDLNPSSRYKYLSHLYENQHKINSASIIFDNKKPLPNLIEARTGNIYGTDLTSRVPPNLKPIKKSTNCILQNSINNIGFGNNLNGFGVNQFGINDFGRNSSQTNQHQRNLNKIPINMSALTTNKHQNASNIAHSSYLLGNTNSVVSQTFNVRERNSYRDLLKKLVPNLYNSNGKLFSLSSKLHGRKSIHSNNQEDWLIDSRNVNNSNPITEQVDLTLDEDKLKSSKTGDNNVINLDDDIDDDEVHIISAYNKLNSHELKEQEKLDQAKKKELPFVEPINSLKERNILSPIYKPNWLENFKSKVEEKHRLRNIKISEAAQEARKQTEETERHERVIEKKLKNFIISSETVILDDEEEEEEIEFPEFSEDDDNTIKTAVYRGSSEEILITKFNMNITRRDIKTLVGDSWLNDEVINFYMNLLMERGEQRNSEGYHKVYAMNTFFIPRLMSSGHSGVRRWTRKVDLFSYDVIPVPVHVGGVHWCMAIIHLKEQTIKYYDSMGTPNPRVLQALEQYLKDECLDKKKQTFDTSSFTKESVSDCPRQMNGSDCGVFSCMFAEYISRGRNITFSQQHMNYFRLKMVLEIVKGKLLL